MTNRELFGNALKDALYEKYTEELEAVKGEAVICSSTHYAKMSSIIGGVVSGKVRRRISKRSIVAIIAAATILLSACAAIIYCKEIGCFIEKFCGIYIKLDNADGVGVNANEISEVYELGYLPEGFELVDSEVTKLCVTYTYLSPDGNKLKFEQRGNDNKTKSVIDSEIGVSNLFLINDLEIYYRVDTIECKYMWIYKTYLFKLEFDKCIDNVEIQKTIEKIIERDE